MDFTRGYTASFYGVYLDPFTNSEAGRFEIIDGSINREESDIRQSASLTLKGYDGLNDQWIRIYMNAKQGSDSERVALFTGLASSPTITYDNGVTKTSVQCYSVLKAVADIILPIGWFAPAFSNGVEQIRRLLEGIPFQVVSYEESPNLEYALVAEDGETNLSMLDAILNSMANDDGQKWKLQIGGDGTIYLSSYALDPVAIFSVTASNVVETSFSLNMDWFNCPNVFRVTDGERIAIARDDEVDSSLSTVNRGREIWMAETGAAVNDNESLGEYAKRRLLEEQSRSETVSYTRRFLPEVNQGDLIRLNYPELQGDFYVESQSISLSYGAKTSESVYRLIES